MSYYMYIPQLVHTHTHTHHANITTIICTTAATIATTVTTVATTTSVSLPPPPPRIKVWVCLSCQHIKSIVGLWMQAMHFWCVKGGMEGGGGGA